MKPMLAAIAVFLLSSLCVACGGSGSGGDETAQEAPPLELVSPTEDVTVARGEKVLFEAVMSEPDRYTSVEFYYDEDAEWDNGNEHAAAFALPAASFTAEWDTVAVNPGEYRIAVVVYQEGIRSIAYADFTVTVTGDELFTFTSPAEDVTLRAGESMHIEGELHSEGFVKVEFMLDPDSQWGNGNEFTIAEFEPDDISGDWSSEGTEAGSYTLVIVLYREHDRFIGYTDRTITVEPGTLPE